MPLKLVPPRAGKTPYWSVRGTYLGVHLDRSTKASSRTVAAGLLRAWKRDIECEAVSRPGEPAFLDAAVAYMAAHGEQRFLPPIVEEFGTKSLASIDQAAIDNLALKLYPGASAATRNRQVYTPVSAILRQAGVAIELRRPKGWRGNKKTDWLWPEQAFAIFKAADEIEKIGAEFGLFLRTLCYTGMRLGEATERFTVANLSLRESLAYLPKTKNEEARAVHLPPVLVAALANHPRGLDRAGQTVFRFRKGGRLYALLAEVRAAVGPIVPLRGFHTFRHTWATWMRRYGGLDTSGLVATQAWKDAASARRYEHTITSEEARKADLLPVENLWKSTVPRRKVRKSAAS